MTVTATNVSTGPYTANGATTAFPFTFAAASSTEVAVAVNGVTVSPSLYSVTLTTDGSGARTGGTATFYTAPVAGASVLPFSSPNFTQDTSFENEGAFLPATFNAIHDRFAIKDLYLLGLYNTASALAVAASAAVAGAVAAAVAAAQAAINAAVFVVTSATGQSVSTRTLLAGISSPVNGQRAYLAESGREGWFQFSTANLATSVTADPYQGLYVAPTAATTGASGAWVREVKGTEYLLSWWGVSAAFGATAHLPMQSAADLVPAGSTLRLPNEAVTTSGVVLLRKDNQKLLGAGFGSEIIHNAATAVFTMIQLARDGCEAAWFTLTHKPSNLNAGNAVALIVSHNASGFVGTASIYRNKVHDLRIRNSSLPFAIFGNVNGTNFAPVVAAEVWNLDVETNVMGMEVFGAFDSEIRSVRVTYFESVTVNNGSNTLTPALRLLGNERVNVHHCEFDGLAAAQLGHDGFRFSVGNSSGANSGRCRNKDVVIENCRFANFYWISQIEECLGDCIIRNNTFVDDTASTRAGSPGFASFVTGNTTLGKVEKVGHLIIEGNTIEGYSHCLSYYGKIGQVTFKNNRWRSNSATSDGQNVLCVYSQFGGVPLVDIIDNQFVAPENALLKIATSTTTEVVRVFGNTVSEATGDANIQTPLSSPTGLINSSGTGVFKANQNWQYPKGTWAARIAYGDAA